MVDCCFNCATPCYAPYLGRITTFHIKSGNGVDNVSVNMAVALSVVFEGALKYSKAKIPTNEGGPPEASIGLCINCAPVLINLYSYYTKFMALSTATSALAKAIRNCRLWSFSCKQNNSDDVCQRSFEDYHLDDNDSDIEILDVKIKEEPGEINFADRHEDPSSTQSPPPPLSHIKNTGGHDVGRKCVVKLERLTQAVDSTKPPKKQLAKRNLYPTYRRRLEKLRRTTQEKYAAAAEAGQFKFKCLYCPKPFKTQGKLDSHIKYFHRSKFTHSCSICSKVFKTLNGLTSHQSVAHQISPPKYISCTICEKKVKRIRLKNHLQFVHGQDYVAPKCQYCGNSYKSPNTLRQHIGMKHKEEILAANPESDNVTTVDPSRGGGGGKDQELVVVKNKNRPYCTICKLKFGSKLAYLQHKLKLHPTTIPKVKRYNCSQCVRVFRERFQLLAHESFIHGATDESVEKLTGRSCEVCGLIFAYPSLLKTHVEKGNCKPLAESQSRITCLLCNEGFESHLHLHHHKINVHRINKERSTSIKLRPPTNANSPSVCQFCNKSFYASTTLTKHIRAVHDSTYKREKPIGEVYTCEICGVSLKWYNNFAKHMRFKHGRNLNGIPLSSSRPNPPPPAPVICQVCGKSLRDMSCLRQHLRSNAHGDSARKYQCSICSRLYSVETNYLNHLKLHSSSSSLSVPGTGGLKPRVCNECGSICSTKANLQRHLFTQHGIGLGVYELLQEDGAPKPYDCSHCGRSFKIKVQLDQHLRTKQHGGPGLDVGRRPRVKNPKRIVLELKELS